MIATLKGSLMLFHYGNCKSKIRELIKEIEDVRKENRWRRDFCINLENEIEEYRKKCLQLEQDLGARTCAFETLAKENDHLNQIISRKDDEIKSLKEEIAKTLNNYSEPEWLHNKPKKKK